jgi:ferredoxin
MAEIYFPQYARGRDGVELHAGESVLQHIRRLGGVEIDSECDGHGACGKDVIRLERGAGSLTPPTEAELQLLETGGLKPGQRLACQATVCDVRHNHPGPAGR